MDGSIDLPSLLDQKSQRYAVISQNGQHLLLEDRNSGGTAVSGKLVDKSSEEFRQRPWLHHRNLAALLDMITINDNFKVFVTDFQGKFLRQLIHDKEFVNSPECFPLKKSFAEDVLCGLEYLHRNNLCLMNLSDANVFICQQQNKAVITEFGSLSEKDNSNGRFSVPFIHQPPEVRRQYGGQFDLTGVRKQDGEQFNLTDLTEVRKQDGGEFDLTEVRKQDGGQFGLTAVGRHQDGQLDLTEVRRKDGEKYDIKAAEMWTMGMMVLEVFTQHKLPWALVEYDPERTLEMIDKVEHGILKAANYGSTISDHDLWEFKEFVYLFIDVDPRNRSTAKNATLAKFLQTSKNNLSSSPQRSLRKLNLNNKSTNSPKVLAYNNHVRQYQDKYKFPQNSTAKSISNVSLKNSVHLLKRNNYSDVQSNYACENILRSETINHSHEKESKSLSNIFMGSSQEEENSSKEFNFSPDSQSKTSVSSQTDHPSSNPDNCLFERKLNPDMPQSVYDDEIMNAINLPSGSHNYSSNSARGTTEISNGNKNTLRKNLSSENEIFQECETKTYASPITDSLRNILKATSSLITEPNQSSFNNAGHHQKPDHQRDLKSTDDVKDSSKKIFRIPASKYQPAEELKQQCLRKKEAIFQEIEKSKLSKAAGKSPLTLTNTSKSDSRNDQLMNKNISESSFNGIAKCEKESNFQENASKIYKEVEDHNKKFFQVNTKDYNNFHTQNNLSTSKDTTNLNGKEKANNMELFNLQETQKESANVFKLEDLNKKLVANMKTQNIINLKFPSSPTIDAMNLVWRNVKYANENRSYNSGHGSESPINKKPNEIPPSNAAKIQDGESKVNVSANKCQSCGSKLNEEPFISRKYFEFPRGSPLPHGYWLSTTTRRAKKPPILSPSLVSGHLTLDPKKAGSGTHKRVLDVSSTVQNCSEEKSENNVFSTAKHLSVSSTSIPNGNVQEDARQSDSFSTNNQEPDDVLPELPEENWRNKGFYDAPPPIPNWEEYVPPKHLMGPFPKPNDYPPPIPNFYKLVSDIAGKSTSFSTNNQAPDVPPELPDWLEENCRNEGLCDVPPPIPNWEEYVPPKHLMGPFPKTSDYPPPIPNWNNERMNNDVSFNKPVSDVTDQSNSFSTNNQAPDIPPELPDWLEENCRNEGLCDVPPPIPNWEERAPPKHLPVPWLKTSEFPPPVPNWNTEQMNNDVSSNKPMSDITHPVSKWNDGEKSSNTDFSTNKRSSVTPPVQNLNKQEANRTNNGVAAHNQVPDNAPAEPTWNVPEEKRAKKSSGEVAVHSKQQNAPRIIVVRGYTGRNTIRVERKPTKCVKKCCDPENHKKTPAKKDEVPSTVQEFRITQDSRGNKKQPKKKNTFKKCFCIGK